NHAASPPVGRMSFGEYLDLISKEPTELRLFLFNLMKIRPELKKDVVFNDPTGGKVLQWLPYMFFGGEGSSTRNHFDIDMSHVFISPYRGANRMCLFPADHADLMYNATYNRHSIAEPKTSGAAEYPGLACLDGYAALIDPGEPLSMRA